MARGSRALLGAALFMGFSAAACDKKAQETPPIAPPISQGAASTDELLTSLGSARGLSPELAPTSTEWGRVFVLDDKRAVITGQFAEFTVAVITQDGGRSFKAVTTKRSDFASWSVGQTGVLVLASGTKEKGAKPGAVASLNVAFAPSDTFALNVPTPLVAADEKKKPSFLGVWPLPAVLSETTAALVREPTPRKPELVYLNASGADLGAPVPLPGPEVPLPAPYGRPPSLLFSKGGALSARTIPGPGEALGEPLPIAGLRADPTAIAALSAPPACENGDTSYQTVWAAGRPYALFVSPKRAAAVALPPHTLRTTSMGCLGEKVVLTTMPPKAAMESFVVCDIEGKCQEPEAPPFRPWPLKHERRLDAVVTTQGVIALMSAKVAERWGIYVTQSLDGGKLYELPRVLGEGEGGRGRIEALALWSFGSRAILLLSADVTGTSRRGFYVMATDDGGATWGPP